MATERVTGWLLVGLINGLFAGSVWAASIGDAMVFPTSPPELVSPEAIVNLMPADLYAGVANGAEGLQDFVVIRDLPETTLSLIGYGINFILNEHNLGFAVFGEPSTGYRLYADVDADGSLADEEGWWLEPEGQGRYSVAFSAVDTGQAAGQPIEVPILSRFLFEPGTGEDTDRPRGAWNSDMVRRGEIGLESRRVRFELHGSGGRYDHAYLSVWFDLDGDGRMDRSEHSPEKFRVLDEYVVIGEQSYSFRVDSLGRHLTLIPDPEARPDRPPLADGEPAPDFQALSIEGRPISLAAHQGDYVLLNFWATWCGPCIQEAPRLAELERRWSGEGLEIVGVTNDPMTTIETFVDRFELTGPQISEAWDGPVHRAYRVDAYPTKYLIDREGHLLCGGPGPGFWDDCWPRVQADLESGHE
ncbi:MAG: TlpA disulfide reductase family protein [Wenzhouxiangella sp.]|jgi:thiol-disulfide isomerase/thioredoxin|nr:TlpA disulfide reductase family protein [Wenzhouxiangella sp.]